jgi:hypothetical protein
LCVYYVFRLAMLISQVLVAGYGTTGIIMCFAMASFPCMEDGAQTNYILHERARKPNNDTNQINNNAPLATPDRQSWRK